MFAPLLFFKYFPFCNFKDILLLISYVHRERWLSWVCCTLQAICSLSHAMPTIYHQRKDTKRLKEVIRLVPIDLLALNEDCEDEALSDLNAAELDAESSNEDSPMGDGTSLNGSSLLVPLEYFSPDCMELVLFLQKRYLCNLANPTRASIWAVCISRCEPYREMTKLPVAARQGSEN